MEAGVQPHIIACRADNPVTRKVREKIAMFSNVPSGASSACTTARAIYTIPEAMREGLDREKPSWNAQLASDAAREDGAREQWSGFTLLANAQAPSIGITGKYTALRDAYASIDKAHRARRRASLGAR
jgi:CTP synthase